MVTDQLGDTAQGTVNVTVDPGPAAGTASATVQLAQTATLTSLVLGAVTPGITGDKLTLTADSTTGTLGAVGLSGGALTYSASPNAFLHIPANGSQADSFGYTVTDQYGDTAQGTVKITVSNPAATINGPANGNATIQGTTGADVINAFGANDVVNDNGGNDVVHLGGSNSKVSTGSGDVLVNLGTGANDQISGGDGWDMVQGGAANTRVTLGNGNDAVSLGGSNNQVALGNGTNTITLTVRTTSPPWDPATTRSTRAREPMTRSPAAMAQRR